ncbi:hypothetical protein [Nostoc sp.]
MLYPIMGCFFTGSHLNSDRPELQNYHQIIDTYTDIDPKYEISQ